MEGKFGPRLIPRPDIGLFSNINRSPKDFEISESRLAGVLHGHRIYKPPSNDELKISPLSGIYKTKKFPYWMKCNMHQIIHESNQKCPKCQSQKIRDDHDEAVRFVLACPDGHLDDINWAYLVHGKSTSCLGRIFDWIGGGGELKNIKIVCRTCKKSINFGKAYGQQWHCSGRFPETESSGPVRPNTCTQHAKIIQRQASNLRIPEIMSFFTIPPPYTGLHRIMEIREIKSVILASFPIPSPLNEEQEFNRMISNMKGRGQITENTFSEISRYSWLEKKNAIDDTLKLKIPATYRDLILEEFKALLDASINGSPPIIISPRPSEPILFEVDPTRVKKINISNKKLKFIITPIERLNTIIIQRGYRRMDPVKGKMVSVHFTDPEGQSWLPGVEFLGEGIFISLENDEQLIKNLSTLNSSYYSNWKESYEKYSDKYPANLFRDQNCKDELHPVFIWWHTLAHVLIRILSVDSGYSASTIRERIYFNPDTGKGGIILYCVQPGSDGALGGLTALVSVFNIILNKAFEISKYCSNDPLCTEQVNLPNSQLRYNGASCYSCTLISETSCEHRNMWLDRNLLK
jgi:hypothetical protein